MSSENLDKMRFGLSVANLIGIVSFAFYIGMWKGDVQSHLEDNNIHMTMQDKMELFIPRSELDVELNNIDVNVDHMKSDIEDIKRIIYREYGEE